VIATKAPPTTLFHITHAKAGSQWIFRILLVCAPQRVVMPRHDAVQVCDQPIVPGAFYPALYLTRGRYESLRLPPGSRRFVVIRDLRDTLVSLYYSLKISHPVDRIVRLARPRLQGSSLEDGLLYLIETLLPATATLQASWLEAEGPLLRYEDLLDRDAEILEQVLIGDFGLPLSRERLHDAVLRSRFERVTRGRERGTEDATAHARKAVVGDWRNHFTDRVAETFKERFGEHLVATGYERDLAW
jgi:Sulfotransferase domain